MNSILREISKLTKFNEYIENIKQKHSPILLSGLSDVGKVELVEATKEYSKKPICLITYNEIEAKKIVEDLKFFSDDVVFFPKKELVTYDYIAESKNLPYERIETLNKIYKNKAKIVVTTIEALMQKLPSKEVLYKNILKFQIGENYNIEEIKRKLIGLGYERYDLIEGKGQFSVRGDIIDISESETKGIRIEFWGDEVDSIRYFKLSSQRSTDMIKEITIFPAHELLVSNISKTIRKIQEKYPEEKEEIVKERLVNQLINGDLYLEVNSNGFEGVYFKYNDKVFRLRCSVHSGMFSNSHLYKLSGVVDFRHYEFRCRYVRTYHFSNTIKRMVVNNISSVEITIDNKSYPVGISTTDITEDSYSEGLISPDCVDGKSCFNRQ